MTLAVISFAVEVAMTLSPVATERAEEIRVRGTVQGVGFRPTVYRLARACGLRGEVCNDGEGVLIRAAGTAGSLDQFVQQLQQECPPLARIEAIARTPIAEPLPHSEFTISQSHSNIIRTSITPDAATCPQCQSETLDPLSRWYRYPFTNCTHCGPRLSIVRAIPYDRANTSMAAFEMCPTCRQEYGDVENRRFHAQPVACPTCGPRAWLERSDGRPITASMFSMLDDVDAVCTLLQKGEIVAIKGIGGFHLACDATNEDAVRKLRDRKHRYHKPFALMARDPEIILKYCTIDEQERELLKSPMAPIVLLQKRQVSDLIQDAADEEPGQASERYAIAPSVAPGMNSLGFMLPYTPLHHLILRRMDRPIILTSGNLSDEPQCIDNTEARENLGSIADFLLLHNRPIVNRIDDSVVRVIDQKPQLLRRARGYAPAPISLPAGFEKAPSLIAMGSELKNTFCLYREGHGVLSQHLGDLENAKAFDAYEQTLNLYLNLFEHQPSAIAIDLHPEYLASKLGEELAIANALPLYRIQHHHAHIAACMVENGLPLEDTAPVLGIALDGLGYGDDSTLWGGEFLLSDYQNFQRLAHLKPVAMLGGEQAIYQPWRNTYAHLMAAFGELPQAYEELELFTFLNQQPRSLLNQMLERGINAPFASSSGRLFDAVAAALGICQEASYEGQGAIALECLAEDYLGSSNTPCRGGFNPNSSEQTAPSNQNPPYPFAITTEPGKPLQLEPRPMWQALLSDLQQGVELGAIAARFHQGFALALVEVVKALQTQHSFTQVALSGGVFQNRLLRRQVQQELTTAGFTVLIHSQVPANDGGLSLGQGAIAAARALANLK